MADELQIRLVFGDSDGQTESQLAALLDGLTAMNEIWFRANPQAPDDLVSAGVRYVDPLLCKSKEFCQTLFGAKELLKRRVGTCADLSAYYAGMWRVRRGMRTSVAVEQQFDHYGEPIALAFHAYVIWPGGYFDAAEQVRLRQPIYGGAA